MNFLTSFPPLQVEPLGEERKKWRMRKTETAQEKKNWNHVACAILGLKKLNNR